MTTGTTVLGLLPLALGLSAGAEIQAPLARVVTGGMLASTLVTLVLIPVAYNTVIADDRRWLSLIAVSDRLLRRTLQSPPWNTTPDHSHSLSHRSRS